MYLYKSRVNSNFCFLEALNLQVLYEALQTRNGDTWEEFLFTKQLIASMDTNNDGVLDFVVNCFILIFLLFLKLFFVSQEFYQSCQKVPMFFKCFIGPLPITLTSQADRIAAGLTMSEISSLWANGKHNSKTRTKGVDEYVKNVLIVLHFK